MGSEMCIRDRFFKVSAVDLYPIYAHNQDTQNDLAILQIADATGLSATPLQLHNNPNIFAGLRILSAGYPDDIDDGVQLYKSSDVVERLDGNIIRHRVDTYKGQSGSPLVTADAPRQVVGIHTSGFDNQELNHGCLIEGESKNWLLGKMVEHA